MQKCHHYGNNVIGDTEMIRTQIQLTEEQMAILKELSAKRNMPLAKLIREAVNAFVKKEHFISQDERKMRAVQAAGQFHSGVPDLAEKHDDYLHEDFEK